MSEGILETKALTRRFGDLVAVDAVSLQIEAGQIFGLLGSNGAGKTTIIKMLTTLLPPSAGTATVAGFDIRRQAAQVRRLIGYVPQMLSADGNLTGYENLLIFAKLYDVPRRERTSRIADALGLMGLEDAGPRLVREYSGGMIRRLEIAQSMLHRPQVLFLDEPTVGLDPIARDSVWERLRQLQAEFKTTVFLTTHEMEEADALCQQIAILHRGGRGHHGIPGGAQSLAWQSGCDTGRRVRPVRRHAQGIGRNVSRCLAHSPHRSTAWLRPSRFW